MDLYVSTDGDDSWSGTLPQPNAGRTDGPLASLTAARDTIRRWKIQITLTEPARVIVADGTYVLTEPFVLEAGDSGTSEAPVSYEAAAGARPVFTSHPRAR